MAEYRVSEEGVPIDHLDYTYVRNCTNVKEVEKILKVLRSRSEGYYPDLIRCTEDHLRKICPMSKMLITSEPAKRMTDLPSEQSTQLNADLEHWASQMSSEETRHVNGPTDGRLNPMGEDDAEESLPPIRTQGSISKADTSATDNDASSKKSERIPSHDFRAWDKFDADKVAEEVDKKKESAPVTSPKGIPLELSESEKSMSSADKESAAMREKNKGNEAYRSGDHQEALAYYTRSIKFYPMAAAFNNRAITEIKLGRHQEAILDCNEVLKLDPHNTKALFRRATAYTSTKEYRAAAEDLECVLRLEPNNKKVQEDLNRLRRDHLETVAEQQNQPRKGRRIEIEESEGEESEPEDTAAEDQPEVKQFTDSPAVERVGGASTSINGSIDPVPSPMAEDSPPVASNGSPEKDETPPLSNGHTADSIKVENEATPHGSAAEQDSPPDLQSLPQEAPPTEAQVAPPPPPPPALPQSVQKLKDEGNDMFRRGQYGEAVDRYTKGIKILQKESKDHIPNISTLLNNRAACHLKNGNSRGCIDDCTKSLELVPINLKALMRRAQAYEAMEKYKDAYNDFHLALRVDNSVEAAYTACSRITRLLRESDGIDWRSKLPEHPDGERIKAALEDHKYRSGSLGGLPLLSTLINVDQGSSVSKEMEASVNDGSPDQRDSSEGEAENKDGGGGGDSETPSAEGAAAAVAEPAGATEGGKRERRKEERKEQTEEKIPEIPPVNVTANLPASPQVTQTTQPVSSPQFSEAPPTGPSLSQLNAEQKFESLKAEGNEHVKKGEFVEALNCYSLCINACPNRVVAYTNRALCHLKLKSPRSAEEDCNTALSFEPGNVKALYRRALARKALTKYMEATKDLKILLEIDPTNSVAQQEFSEVKQLWAKKLREIQMQKGGNKPAPSSQKTKSGKVGGNSRKKSGQKKSSKERESARTAAPSNPLTELEKTRHELERLLQEARKKEAAQSTQQPGQTRRSELDKLLKETRAKTKGGGTESKSAERKGSGTKAPPTEPTASEPPPTEQPPTASPPEARVPTEEKVTTKEKSDSESHLTASKTTYYKGKGKGKAGKGGKTTPPKTAQSTSEEVTPSSSSEGEKKKKSSNGSKRKKVVVEEGPESDENGGGGSEEAAAPSQPADTTSPSSPAQKQAEGSQGEEDKTPSQPAAKAKGKLASPYEFVQRWNAIPRTAQSIDYARLLEQIDPEKLPEVITNKLDGMMLTNIIRAIDKQFIPKRQYKLSVDILLYLTKVPRFQMNAMFLGPIEKQDLKNIFVDLSEHHDELSVPAAMLGTVRRAYGLDS